MSNNGTAPGRPDARQPGFAEEYWVIRDQIGTILQRARVLQGSEELRQDPLRQADQRKLALVVTKLDEARLWLEDMSQ